jgi:hypothetical protein
VSDVTEYRAFDKKGAIIGEDDLTDTDEALSWGVRVAVKGAVLIERKAGEEWVCFEEYRRSHQKTEGTPR